MTPLHLTPRERELIADALDTVAGGAGELVAAVPNRRGDHLHAEARAVALGRRHELAELAHKVRWSS